MIIKDKFDKADSSLLLRSVDLLKARNSVSSKDNEDSDFIIPQASQTLFIVYIDTKQQLHSHIIQLVQ